MISISFANFDQTFNHLCETNQKCIMLFTGSIDSTGESWCGDCRRIVPLYSQIEAQAAGAGLPIYKFDAGDRLTWKSPGSAFKTNPRLRLTNLPTLGLFDGGKLRNVIIEGEICDKEQRMLVYE